MSELDEQDQKLVTLARGALGRTGGSAGAAVRDTEGRSYAAGPVQLAALRLSALQAAVAAAISSAAAGFEAAVVIGDGGLEDPGVAALYEVSPQARVIAAAADGTVRALAPEGPA